MNMYHSPKKFSEYIVPTLTSNDKKHIHYNSGHMVTFTQCQQHLGAQATFAHSDPKHLQHLQEAAVTFVYHHNNIPPTTVTVTLIKNSGSIYTQWHKHLHYAAVTFTSSSGYRFIVNHVDNMQHLMGKDL